MGDKAVAHESESDVVKIPRAMAQKLRVIAAARRRSLKDLIEKFAGPAVDREYRRVVAEMGKQFDVGGEG